LTGIFLDIQQHNILTHEQTHHENGILSTAWVDTCTKGVTITYEHKRGSTLPAGSANNQHTYLLT